MGHPGHDLRDGRAFWALWTLCRRIDLRDLAKAIGFGVMRPRDKRSAHFCAIPARYNTEPERLFCFDVARRKILHELHEVCFQVGADFFSNAGVKFPVVRRTTIRSGLIGEPGKIRKYRRDQIAMTGVVRS